MPKSSIISVAFMAVTLFCASSAGARAVLPIYTESHLVTACTAALARGRADAAALQAVPLDKVTVANTLNAWNRMQMRLEDVLGPTDLYANVFPEERVRAAADACLLKYNSFNTEIFQNENLYRRFKAVKTATPHQRQLRKDLLETFEDKGVALAPEKRAQVKAILDRLEVLRQEFDKNVREDKTRLSFTAEEMQGLPRSYLDRARRDDKGNYLLGFDYPEFEPFMNLADNEAARQRYYIAFTNRGGERNLRLLNDIMQSRLVMAKSYGLPSYAHLAVRHKMVENPRTVHAFLTEVGNKVREVEAREVNSLAAYKAESLGNKPEGIRLNRWDVRYYQEKLRKARFDIDQEALRKYFPMPAAVDYAMLVAGRLYGVKFERADVPVWHPEVRYYDVLDANSGKFLAGIYLDLYPRDGKYKHAAAWPVRGVSRLAERTPIAALVTNFNREGLDHRELETLLHEFGHVLHGVLSMADYNTHAGTNVAQDFVEAPSQMFEEWARRPEALSLMRKVCVDCPIMDKDLIRRLDEARKFGAGIRYARQLLYASYDMAMTSDKPGDVLAVWKKMEGDGPLGYIDGSMFPANFSHIANSGYGAGYYGYMWSQVLALDMLSAFGDNIMNPAVGRRFREMILAQGGQVPAKELVRRFLGREPSSEAFFAEITGQRQNLFKLEGEYRSEK